MDKVFINGLRAAAVIGCYPAERERKQNVILDIEFCCDLQKAGVSDELADTINYAEIEERVLLLAESSSYRLIEALAGAVGRLLLEYDGVSAACVRVEKPGGARYARSVAVEMEFRKG